MMVMHQMHHSCTKCTLGAVQSKCTKCTTTLEGWCNGARCSTDAAENVRRRVGGHLNYHLLAQQHRPADTSTLAAEVLRLYRNGLTATDISSHLRLPLAWTIEVVSRGAP